mgnify:CR=1 FL=1
MKIFVFDIMLKGRFVCTLRYEYCALFPIDLDELTKFILSKRPTLRNQPYNIANEIEPYILRVTKSKCMPSLAKDYLMEAVDLCYQKVIDKKILVQSPRKWLSFATRNFVYCKEKAVKLRNI